VQNPLQRRRNLLIGSLRQTVLLPEVENAGVGKFFSSLSLTAMVAYLRPLFF
jgi:hypothetical protein